MAENQVQSQKGYSVFDFMQDFGTEDKCEKTLFNWRFPQGYVCRECSNTTYCQLKCRKLLQCNRCGHQHSLTSGKLFAHSKLPLTKWFMAIHLLTQSKTELSAMELKRQLGVNYDTAWKVKHKLLQAMKESEDKSKIGGIVQLDYVYWGGEHRGGKRGRGAGGKTPFLAAVALNEKGHAIAPKHLPRHLAEYCFRFNNRFNLRDIMPRQAKAAVRTPPMPYKLLKLAEVRG
ncbi:hypothetical protein BM523_17925 [Alteromonas mediterranea]|uniref:IS1595 family transposase n=1 Tax=Alteromonas mediterranea TaxID=314275 RepID=UPI0009036535|nr:IS1595 family transposase [Alteromonas mediterranea]APD95722.1 hypothetical protein BM523_17925 [Alteromonas mediterranea]APD99356.1 hypothetical protein BM525_17950 [Alteromonas mediterranea]